MDAFIVQAPEFPAAFYWRGLMKLEIGQDDDAHGDFSRALRAAPEFVEAMVALGRKHLNELNYKEARACAEDGLKAEPDLADAWALRGFARFCEDDAAGATEDLEIALKLDPDSSTAQEYHRNVVNVRKGPQHLGCKFVKEFPHYVVMTDISMEKTKLYGERLEAAFQYYAETFKEFFTDDPKRKKPRVAIFFTKEAYLTYGELTLSRRQEWTLGYFHPMYKELLLFEDADQEETLQTLYHEAFHQFMNLMVGRAPYWYNEGIAEYMGSIKVDKGRKGMEVVAKAQILDGRLKSLKMQIRQALDFQAIMTQTPSQFYGGNVSFKYAQAWSMIHFFYQHEGGKYRKLIDAYHRKLKEGGDIKEAFDAGFGEADLAEMKKEWLEYVKKLEPVKK
jgi:tetratricopeptide (TPR) repeat protein